MLNELFHIFNVFIFVYVIIVDGFYLMLFFLSFKQIQEYLKRSPYNEIKEFRLSSLTTPISIIVPAYNEEKTISNSISSLLQINYPEFEIIVVNDGSNDETIERLKNDFSLIEIPIMAVRKKIKTETVHKMYRSTKHPSLLVIDKENGGKADSLNVGINFSTYPYFCSVDADSMLEPDSLMKAMKPFFEGGENVVACGGIIRVINGCSVENGYLKKVRLPKNKLAISQVIEYLRSFLMGRLGLSSLNNLLIVSGAFGIFRKHEVLEVGGYDVDNLGEDMELIVSLQKYLYKTKSDAKVLFVPDPVCWTEVPEDLRSLAKQRTRWQVGLLQTLIKHKDTLFNPRYKSMGLLAMPYFLFVELLGPTIELLGMLFVIVGLYFDLVNIPFAILYFVFTLVFGVFLSVTAILLEEYSFRKYERVSDLFRLLFYSILENFWFRQINAVFKTWGFIRFMRKDRRWGLQNRKGFSQTDQQQVM
ncbi:glycosyltransferase [Pseudalkalibacillus sp. SCS-8]|uniref:glycosyltransferase family 2 protein n=1 Tax=Pseudalkalibacillus nanhaiensis TaxID=3115291 RepID=UPI0032DA7215